jgi:hypothetical protein
MIPTRIPSSEQVLIRPFRAARGPAPSHSALVEMPSRAKAEPAKAE